MEKQKRYTAITKLHGLKKNIDELILKVIQDEVELSEVSEEQWLDDIDLVSDTFDGLFRGKDIR